MILPRAGQAACPLASSGLGKDAPALGGEVEIMAYGVVLVE